MIRLAVVLLLLLGSAAWAVQPEEQLPDRQLEARARAISAGLRCLVCQNESIDDSDAPLAHDLRVLVRQRLQAGDSDETARDFIVARYGEYVLLKPRFDADTALLWLTPLIALAIGFALILGWRSRSPSPDAVPLSSDEEESLQRILSAQDDRMPPAVDLPETSARVGR